MLKHLGRWLPHSSPLLLPRHLPPFSCRPLINTAMAISISPYPSPTNIKARRVNFGTRCGARRRVIYDDDDDEDEDHEYNEEIAMLETYTLVKKDEVLVVNAIVDEELVEVLIFKGFSSCLSYKTSSDPSRSVLPPKAVIKSIDRVRGPFDPSDIQYIEKGLTLDAFKKLLM